MKIKLSAFIILFFLLSFVFGTLSALAQKDLSIEYPDIPGVEEPETTQTPLPVYLKYAYSFAIYIAGFLAFVLLVWAGIRYVSSAGNPDRLKEAKNQITASFIGLIIIFSSYFILNTINPQLVVFHIPGLSTESELLKIPPKIYLPPIQFQEIPVGTLITSEINVSSFVRPSSVSNDPQDPDTDSDEYGEAFVDTVTYPTDYQGGLQGRRLKRIHEVTITTLPVVTMLTKLSSGLVDAVDELESAATKLYQNIRQCRCSFCTPTDCLGNGRCNCSVCACRGDPCPEHIREEMKELIKKINTLKQGLIAHRMTMLEYLTLAFEAFLDSGKLVKNEDYQDDSYWYSSDAEELRQEIEDYISGITDPEEKKAEQEKYDAIEELIDLMAEVENKGTYSPITDPPERDIETNIYGVWTNLQYLELSKTILNPEHPAGCFPQPYSLLQFSQIADSLNLSVDELKSQPIGDVRVIEDPATFYCSLAPTDSPRETLLLEDVPPETSCDPHVEIPIGKTIDEAIQLMEDILRELGNPLSITAQGIWNQGHSIINNAVGQTDDATSLQKASENLVNFVTFTCEQNCLSTDCIVTPSRDADGNPHCQCTCLCTNKDGPPYSMEALSDILSEIRISAGRIRIAYAKILQAKNRIYNSFYMLNSEYPEKDPEHPDGHPDAGEKVPIGEDICCNDPGGYCRDPNNTKNFIFSNNKAEKREYTLKEKIIEIQKLLNMSRDVATHTILLKDLIEMDLATQEELNFVTRVIDVRLDLSNCDVLITDLAERAESGLGENILENCWLAGWVNFKHIYADVCSLDPPYDCEYFDDRVPQKRSGLLCYCFDHAFYPEVASDFFCCKLKQSVSD